MTATAARAAHLLVDAEPRIFADPLAVYMLTADLRDADGATYVDLVMPDSERRGEPWLSFFTPEQMTGLLTGHGFTGVRHVRQRDAVSAALWERTDRLRPIEVSRLCHATVGSRG